MGVFNISDKNTNLVYSLYKLPETPLIKQRKRRFETNTDEIFEQKTSVTCDLNNGIKELNNEIKRLYNNLMRLDDRVSREKRDLRNQTAIVDCIQMKEKFNKIYKDLNRISETLSMVDDNGICRCKCPLDKIARPSAEVALATDEPPFELTTFNLENTDKPSGPGEKTMQHKKIILSEYDPQNVVDNVMTNKRKYVIDEGRTFDWTTTVDENKFTSTRTPEDATNLKGTVTTTETNEDMSPAMSNAITNRLHYVITEDIPKNDRRTTENIIIVTSEEPKSPTRITDSKETVEMTGYDEKSTTPAEKRSDREIILKSKHKSDYSLDSTTEIYNYNKNENDSITENTSESTTSSNEIISESTTEIFVSDKDEMSKNITDETFESTTLNGHISELDTEINVYYKNEGIDIADENASELTTSSNENNSELTTETYVSGKGEKNIIVTDGILELTSTNDNISGSTTAESPGSGKYEIVANNVAGNTPELASTHKNVSMPSRTTEIPVSEKRETSTAKGAESALELKPTVGDASERTAITATSAPGKNVKDADARVESSPEDKKSATADIDHSNTTHRTEKTTPQLQQPQWYPICFYPVPCSPSANVFDRGQQNVAMGASKATDDAIQYSAQSLNSYKKKAPLAGATVIQNGYPIITYCPVGMVCPMTDVAGQATNVLHCMMRFPVMYETPGIPQISVNAADGKYRNVTAKSNSRGAGDGGSGNAKTARDSEEIITGNQTIH